MLEARRNRAFTGPPRGTDRNPALDGRAIVIAPVVATLLGAAPAHAAVVSGSGADPADPALAGGRDLTAVAASYDDAGTVSATVTLREPPSATADGFVDVFVGTSTASGECSALVGLGAYLDPPAPTRSGSTRRATPARRPRPWTARR
jgi:hypothetical protein